VKSIATKGATVEDQARIGLFAVFCFLLAATRKQKNKLLRHIPKITT
jgi:hypothetical protein